MIKTVASVTLFASHFHHLMIFEPVLQLNELFKREVLFISILDIYKLRIFFFSVKDRNLFHRVDTIGNIFTSGAAMSENNYRWCSRGEIISIFHRKKKCSVYFML